MPERLSQDQVNKLYEMMYILHNLFMKYGIRYIIISGSLLGAVRDRGLITMDDDIDIGVWEQDEHKLMKLKTDISKYDLLMTKTDPLMRTIYRVFPENGDPLCKDLKLHNYCMDFKFPFIDIFILKQTNKHILFKDLITRMMYRTEYFNTHEVFPLRLVQFGPLQLVAPRDPIPYLNRLYGPDWPTTKRSIFNHRTLKLEQSEHKIDSYNHEYPDNIHDWAKVV